MSNDSIPLIKALKEHRRKTNASFHVPGHKNGLFFHESLYEDFKHVLSYDLTELEHLDDLHAPEGVIKDAQDAAAQLYGAVETFFLVGGTTVGNLAMVFGLFERGDLVFIQRNSHKSVFHAAQIAGVIPVLLSPHYDERTHLPVGVTCETLKKALTLYPQAKGIILTYPNYYGVSLDTEPLIRKAKEHGLLVLVDEAHAAHYQIGPPFPKSTLTLGADAVVQSAHKMLPALTMSSYLHVGDGLKKEQVIHLQEALSMFQSSSPSYLLMASLDGARAYLESLDNKKLTFIFLEIERIKQELRAIDQISIIDWKEQSEGYHSDPLKVTIRTNTSLTGYELQRKFYEVGLYPEMADEWHVLLVFGLGVMPLPTGAIERLKENLLPYKIEDRSLPSYKVDRNEISKLYVLPNEAKFLPKKSIPLLDSEGFIAAEPIIPYPPGSPLLLVGEKINEETLVKIKQLQKAGARFQGHQGEMEYVSVLEVEER